MLESTLFLSEHINVDSKNFLMLTNYRAFVTERRYASAGICCRRVSVLCDVSLCVTRRYCIETAARIELIYLRTGLPGPMLCCVLGKLWYLQ